MNIDSELLIKAKSLAAKERTHLTRLIEQGLMLRLKKQTVRSYRHRPDLPVSGKGGLQKTISDTLTHRALLDAVDDAS
ncbi:MAG: DUF2191 domain-containing protein [Rhodocyclaceae bacterium]|nr:DUF2191 domain-containing protein [Rhodocyclaceae bacterium]